MGDRRDQVRALADQQVAAVRAGSGRRARHGHHLAAIIARPPRGDQRSRFRRRLDHHRAVRDAGDDAVARGEVARERFGAGGLFGDEQLVACNLFLHPAPLPPPPPAPPPPPPPPPPAPPPPRPPPPPPPP